MKTMRCSDYGFECNHEFRGRTKDDVMNQAIDHGRRVHGISAVTPEVRSKIESLIHDEGPMD